MSEKISAKVLVVGGGPGGYVAAIRAGQLGLDTVLVEAGDLGGTCLTRGCIPSKALIHAADTYSAMRDQAGARALGINVEGPVSLDMARTTAWKDEIVRKLSGGVGALLRKARVRVERGWATFRDAKTCRIQRADGSEVTVQAEHVILATGSVATELSSLPFGGAVISSTEALALEALPGTIAVVGAGYIGLELGFALRKLGCDVTIVEAADRVLSQYDKDLVAPVLRALERLGVAVHVQTTAKAFESGVLTVEHDGQTTTLNADLVLVTVGRRPRTAGWGLEAMGVDLRDGFVAVDDQCRTSMRNVWAIGDLVGEPMLAHKASAQGAMVAEIIAGARRRFAPAAIPAVCFTDPEIAVVGDVSPSGEDRRVDVFPFAANGRSLTMAAGEGFVRVVSALSDQRILGMAAVGRHISELSGEMTVLIEMGGRLEDVAHIIHAHPTQSEVLQEAALRALGQAVHI